MESDSGMKESHGNLDDSNALQSKAVVQATGIPVVVESERVVETESWQKTLDSVVSAVVAIKFCLVRHFDTERASYSVATGFVVDKKNGLILTNRHVVTPGPVTAEAIFLNHEEVPLLPIYRDPIHDFGFYKFDPAAVKFMEVSEIELAPNDARIGVEIRVIGNDAGEKLSILSGTLARLDRPAPFYGEDKYNDFNIFYYQAASSTSGGSSGSPVINKAGKALAMVAGGRVKAASSFYLPLHQVARALGFIQQGILEIPRGTLQTVFRHCPYDEVHRLGLRSEIEAEVRKRLPSETGMLVVDQVIPAGPADKILEPGDIVTKINGSLTTTFLQLEDILDNNIGKEVTFSVERGNKSLEFRLKSQNMHEITPSSFLEVGGGVLHALSFQLAKNHRLPVGSIFVAAEGYIFGRADVHRGSVIRAINGIETPTLESIEKVLCDLPNHARVPVRYINVNDRYQERLSVIVMDRVWHPMQLWTRLGKWDPKPSVITPKPDYVPRPASVSPVIGSGVAGLLSPSLVMVTFTIPYVVDGGSSDTFLGTGLILDADKGLVLVDQNTVPMAIGDMMISFGATMEIPAEVVFIHPIHNIAIVKYNPDFLQEKTFKSAVISKDPLHQGDAVYLVGLTRKHQPVWQATTVSKIEELFINESRPPRFRAINEEVIHLDKAISCVGGVLVNAQGHVQAFWASYSSSEKKNPTQPVEFFRGFSMDLVLDILEPLQKGLAPNLRSLEVEMWPVPLAQARDIGLSEEWVKRFEASNQSKRHVLNIRRVFAQSDASTKLKTGDLILSVNGRVCTTFRDVELATQAEQVEVTLFRDKKEITVTVSTALLNGEGTQKIACWAGAILQNTHKSVAQLGFVFEGVYCSRWYFGSPAHKYALRAAHWIVEVNGKPTPNLDAFLDVVSEITNSGDTFVRLKIMGLQDKVMVTSLSTDNLYWPTWVLYKHPEKKEWCLELLQQSHSKQ